MITKRPACMFLRPKKKKKSQECSSIAIFIKIQMANKYNNIKS